MFLIKKNIVARKIHDSYFLIDICQKYLEDKCYLYEINEIGYFIWHELNRTSDINKVVSSLLDTIIEEVSYEEIYEEIYEDVKEFINMLQKENFLEVVNA